jgi:hypothetical protein
MFSFHEQLNLTAELIKITFLCLGLSKNLNCRFVEKILDVTPVSGRVLSQVVAAFLDDTE